MSIPFDYTQNARRIALRYPILSSILTQINFWIIAYMFLVTLLHFQLKAIVSVFPDKTTLHYLPSLLMGILGGVVFGLITGGIYVLSERSWLSRWSVGLLVLLRTVLNLLAFLLTWLIIRITWDNIIEVYVIEGETLRFGGDFHRNIFMVLLIYTALASLLINFIRQVNRSFGPGVLIPMVLGRYRRPRVEERIFMFMDLKSSTTYAELLGHERYSHFIQDCFLDIDQVLPDYNAQIYQYVGDEVVLTWKSAEGLRALNCIRMFFAYRQRLEQRSEYYQEKYGLVPEFKAGLHLGEVMAAEVGEIKREIAYHGDTINTAARIQSVCNQYGQSLLISAELRNLLAWTSEFRVEKIGDLLLKGKREQVEIWGVAR